MSDEKKNKVGNILAIIVLVASCLLPLGFAVGTEVLFWVLIVINLLFGPVCFIGYLMEVKRGVCAYDDGDKSED